MSAISITAFPCGSLSVAVAFVEPFEDEEFELRASKVVPYYENGKFELPNGKRGFIEKNLLSVGREIQWPKKASKERKIQKKFNDFRRSFGAANMYKMRWDPMLADLAQGKTLTYF